MEVMGRLGENISDDAFRERTGSLVLLLDYLYPRANGNVRSVLPLHRYLWRCLTSP